MDHTAELRQRVEEFGKNFSKAQEVISKIFLGQPQLVTHTLLAFLCNGHVLLEGLPGLGKTLLAETLSKVLAISCSRIQATPDLMPADILGTNVLWKGGDGALNLRYEKGPIFADMVLVDEINRATPRTQSALLQAMQEKKVTVFGITHPLPEHFMVIATQNPIEMEGTYPLPEAQLDRFFFKLIVEFPNLATLMDIGRNSSQWQKSEVPAVWTQETIRSMKATLNEVCIADPILEYASQMILNSHPNAAKAIPLVKKYVMYGASPRGLQALVQAAKVHSLLAGRVHVAREDFNEILMPSLQHRLILKYEAEAEGIHPQEIILNIQEHCINHTREKI